MPLTVHAMSKRVQNIKPEKLYTVFKNQINVDNFDLQALQAKMRNASNIFQQPFTNGNDFKRKQISENDLSSKQRQAVKPITDLLTALFKEVGDGTAKPSGVSVLLSEPGCMRQHLHRDFNFKKRPRETIMSYLAILALQDDTKLVVLTENGLEIITLNRGDLFIGRGDLVHSGSEYECMNIRLHWYIDYDDNKRDLGDTYFYHESTGSTTKGKYYDFFTSAENNLKLAHAGTKKKYEHLRYLSRRMTDINNNKKSKR